MKNIINIGFSILCLFVLSCKEEPVIIPKSVGSSTAAHKVVVEEYTGVKCVNCPAGSAEIENLRAKHGENLIAVSIHAGLFAKPYTESKYDLKTKVGEEIMNYVAVPEGYPSATIDRKVFSGQTSTQVGQSTWAGYIDEQLKSSAPLKVTLSNVYDAASRTLKAKISILPTQNISEKLRLTVMITESNIVDYQSTTQGKNANYKHKHVLRDLLTAATGDDILAEWKIAILENKTFTYKIPDNWNPDNCSVIAFVHRANANDKSILNADEKPLK